MWRAVASNGLTLLIVIFLVMGGMGIWAKGQYAAPGPLEASMCFRVPSGANFRDTADRLAEQGAVQNASFLRIGARYEEKTTRLKAGSFLIPAGASMAEVSDIVTRGGANTCGSEIVYRIGVASTTVQLRELDPQTERLIDIASYKLGETRPAEFAPVVERGDARHRIAMAEGVTNWQIIETLKAMDVLRGDVSDVPAEGMMAPFSYELQRGETRQNVINRMVARQANVLNAAWDARAKDLPLANKAEALILASIIEKETSVPDERRIVSSVFVNRLNRGMPLQTDPTVIYGITRGEGVLGRGLRRSELDLETPWNTYKIRGLPPTPIANPGRAAIEAALNPEDTKYVFFVADGTGGHAFAETLAEHNRNVAAWRKIEAQSNN